MRRLLTLLGALLLALTPAVATAAPAAGAAFPDRIELPDGFAPEGITSGRGTTFYVGSLAGGAIYRGDVRTGQGSVLVPASEGTVAVGVDYDASTDRLWVAGGPTGQVRAYDATSGRLLVTYSVNAPTGFLNDVTVTRDAVYVTDSNVAQLVVIPLGPGRALPDLDAATTVPLTGDIVYQPGFNANGIVSARGGRVLLVVQSNTGLLFRVDPTTGTATQVNLGGASLTFGDGLALRGTTLYVVRNRLDTIEVVRLCGTFTSGRLLSSITSPELDVPTTVTLAAGGLYAVNARFGTPVTPNTQYWVTRLPTR